MVWLGEEEPTELRLLRELLRPGDTFVDCGANIGLWSLVAASAVGNTGRVIAIEANPVVAQRLVDNAQQASCVEVQVAAASAACGEVRFDPGDHHNLGRVSATAALSVPTIRIDDVVVPPVSGIKVDVEGFELPALEGARATIESSEPWIFVEFNRDYAGNALGDWAVDEYLSGLGYRPFSLDGQPLPPSWAPEYGYANVLYRTD
jgi:FkbM family methyltransferase